MSYHRLIIEAWNTLFEAVMRVALAFMLFLAPSASLSSISDSISDSVTEVVLGVGSQTTLKARGVSRITVSNGKVIKAEDLGERLRLTGRKRGSAAVELGSIRYFIHVLPASTFHLYKRLADAVSRMQGLHLAIEDERIAVTGRLLRLSDWIRLSELTTPANRFLFQAEIDPSIRANALIHISKRLTESGLPVPDLQLSPARIRLSNERSSLAGRFETALGAYGFVVEKKAGVLTLEPLIRVNILVTELRKKFLRRVGIEWPASYQAQLLPSWIAPGSSGSQAITIQLNGLEENGDGRILASPNLLCRSGKEAQFLAGGEFPIKITSNKRQDVVWKKHGILLHIKPLADFSGRMSIELDTEVSGIDTSRSIDGLPALYTNRIKSHFDLHGSRTIALSGLLKHESGRSSSGLPGLNDIPILGSLFSSREFRDEKTELVVFVTPEVINPPGDASKDRQETVHETIQEKERETERAKAQTKGQGE